MRMLIYIVGFILYSSSVFSQKILVEVNGVSINFQDTDDLEYIDHQRSEVIVGNIYRYLLVDEFLTKEEHDNLDINGITLLDYVGHKTYLASIPNDIKGMSLSKIGFKAISKLYIDTKASYDVDKDLLPEYAISGSKAKLIVNYAGDIDPNLVLKFLEYEGVQVDEYNGANPYIQVSCDLDFIEDLIALPYIMYVEVIPPPAIKDDTRGRNLHRVNRVNGVNGLMRNYTGKNVSVLVRDDGKVFDHIDFKGRINQVNSGVSEGDHGDGVAGIFCGTGNLDPYYAGMATDAFMYVNDYQSNFLDETLDLHTDDDVLVTNSSYSDGCNRGYSANTRTVDMQMRQNPKFMHVFSAGNSGQGIFNNNNVLVECGYGAGLVWGNITGGHKIGKNVIATANLNYRGQLEDSSSRGPASDGRIKPDLAANGFGHESTAENHGYRTFGGTSAAAPVVAGVMTLLHEAYTNIYGDIADAALLKTIMLNTANDMGNVGPDFKFGWGAVNAHKSALVLEENRFVQGTISQGQSISHTIAVPEGTRQLKVMTYWVDRENVTSTNNHLVNDINTTLTNGTDVYMPWVLDHSPDPIKLNLPATTGEDHKNNMEQIAINNPSTGEIELTLNGDVLPFGDADYFVVWEYETDEVDIIYPNGGENLEMGINTVIHWDAYGVENPFLVQIFDDNDSLILERMVSGEKRLLEVRIPRHFNINAKLSITRNGQVEMSDGGILISEYTKDLVRIDSLSKIYLSWPEVVNADAYYIYRLGDKFMEIVDTVSTNIFEIPDDPFYTETWLAVSAVFENNAKEGKRSLAIPGQFVEAKILDNDLPPCKDKPFKFEAEFADANISYLWKFGDGADPDSALTVGPHEVIYNSIGPKVIILTLDNFGGISVDFQVIIVGDIPVNANINETNLGGGIYSFTSSVQNADSLIWDMGDGTILIGESVEHEYQNTGTFEVRLTAINGCGEIELTKSISVLMVGIEDISIDDFTLRPNPSDGHLELSIPDLEGHDLRLRLFGMDGRLLTEQKVNSLLRSHTLDYSSFNRGIYELKLTFDNKTIMTKIVVQ